MNTTHLSNENVALVDLSEAELETVTGGEMGAVSSAVQAGTNHDMQMAQEGARYANRLY